MVTSPRADRDVFRLAPSMDEGVLRTVAERLEFRATDPGTSSCRRRTSTVCRCRRRAGFWRSDAAPASRSARCAGGSPRMWPCSGSITAKPCLTGLAS